MRHHYESFHVAIKSIMKILYMNKDVKTRLFEVALIMNESSVDSLDNSEIDKKKKTKTTQQLHS